MEITANNIKILRGKSGAGIVDCKQAIEEARGDIEKALDILRKKGITKAAKRSGREASEGIIKVSINKSENEGYIVEINSETDFVARNDQFQSFAGLVIKIIEDKKPQELDQLMEIKISDYMAGLEGITSLNINGTVKEGIDSISGIIGEKIEIKRFNIIKASAVAAYSHLGGKIGVLVGLDKPDQAALARDIAMQIAAANPTYITPEEVPADEIEKEKEIHRAQLLSEGKPENIIDKILAGKINKYYEEICLVKQEYIKDDKKKVADILGEVKVEKFIRYSL